MGEIKLTRDRLLNEIVLSESGWTEGQTSENLALLSVSTGRDLIDNYPQAAQTHGLLVDKQRTKRGRDLMMIIKCSIVIGFN